MRREKRKFERIAWEKVRSVAPDNKKWSDFSEEQKDIIRDGLLFQREIMKISTIHMIRNFKKVTGFSSFINRIRG